MPISVGPTCSYFQSIGDTCIHLKPLLSPTNGYHIDSLRDQPVQSTQLDSISVPWTRCSWNGFFAFSGLEFKVTETEGWRVSVIYTFEPQFARAWLLSVISSLAFSWGANRGTLLCPAQLATTGWRKPKSSALCFPRKHNWIYTLKLYHVSFVYEGLF